MKKTKQTPTENATEMFYLLADNQYTLSELKRRKKQGKFLTIAEERRLSAAAKKSNQTPTQA